MSLRTTLAAWSAVWLASLAVSIVLVPAALTDSARPKPRPTSAPSMAPLEWNAPPSYSVDMVIQHGSDKFTMHRTIDGPRIRTDFSSGGQSMSIIELGDEDGTTIMLEPDQKQAIKQSRRAMEDLMGGHLPEAASSKETSDRGVLPAAEPLGREQLDGKACDKFRYHSEEGDVLAWLDAATGAPVRMESKEGVIEWQKYKPGPQPKQRFEVPKGVTVTDMDEMMKSMSQMGGSENLKMLMGGAGMPGMGAGSMVKGMAGGMAGQMGNQMGSTLGAQMGGALGGPLGMIAGSYLGGKIGEMVGHKAADLAIPGK